MVSRKRSTSRSSCLRSKRRGKAATMRSPRAATYFCRSPLISRSWSRKSGRSSERARSRDGFAGRPFAIDSCRVLPVRRRRRGIVRILYVEDNDDNVYVIKNRFARVGFTALVATDGEQGVAMAATERPDLILMDLGLPGLDGWEATKRIKSEPETPHIPVIALSAHAMTGDREKALAAGCDDFDTKPVEMSRLLSKVRALLSKESP